VRWLNLHKKWQDSSREPLGWNKPDKDMPFAVPEHYVFAEDRAKGQWLFHIPSKTVYSYSWNDQMKSSDWIEITADQKAYLETKHEGYELRKQMFGDLCIELDGGKRHIHSIPPLETIGGFLWVRVPVEVEPSIEELAQNLIDALRGPPMFSGGLLAESVRALEAALKGKL